MLQVNVIALTELTRLVLPQMVARKRGKVMLLASLAAFQPGPGMAVYYATKSFVLSFGRAIGHELRGTGVTITTLCPGATTSEFAQVANMQGSALFKGPVPVMTAAEVARQGYAALKAGRPQIITGLINRITAFSTFHADGNLVDDCRSSKSPRKRAVMSSWCGSPGLGRMASGR